MIAHKKKPKKQLEKYSTIFTQIGLILVLFITYILVEHKTEVKELRAVKSEVPIEFAFIPQYDVYEIEKVKKEIIKEPLPKIFVKNFKKVDNETKIPEPSIFDPVDPPKFNIDSVRTVEVGDSIKDEDDPKVYDARMYTPIFKGCEGLEGDKNRECFESKLRKFVQKKFDTDLGLDEGVYKIFSEFVINKQGEITSVRIKAPSKGLEKEMRRVIRKLPKFIPGKQGDKPVNVKYMLPLAFKVN